MKILSLFVLSFLLSFPALAGFRVPPSIFTAAQWDTAVAKAKADKKPITVLMSDKDTTCPLCSNASGQIMNALRTPTVMVYARSWHELPANAQAILHTADEGKFIPWAGVMTADSTKLLGMVTYEQVKSQGVHAFSNVRKAIAAYRAGG